MPLQESQGGTYVLLAEEYHTVSIYLRLTGFYYSNRMRRLLLLVFCLTPTLSYASIQGGHEFGVGPQYYHMDRSRETSSNQLGSLYGIKAMYSRIDSRCVYLGVNFVWAAGSLDGSSIRGYRLHSHIQDTELEGRIGYAYRFNLPLCPLICAYSGYGYFQEDNHLREPTPFTCDMMTHFHYLPLGLITRFALDPRTCIELDAKVEFPFNIRSKIMGLDNEGDIHFNVLDCQQYVIELSLKRKIWRCLGATFKPFWWYRHYGGFERAEGDFLDTRIRIVGLRFEVNGYF